MWLRADNVRGLKPGTEARDSGHSFGGAASGRGALSPGRSGSVSSRGLVTSADAGISSAKTGANPVHRKPKVSAARLVRRRSVGPKARPLGVADGCQVYIPEPGVKAKLLGTRVGGSSGCWYASPARASGGREAKAKRSEGPAEKSHAGTTRSDRTANRHR